MTLPNFLLIGPGRSGTTSLYHWLNEHPQIYMSPVKEACYYAADLKRKPSEIIATREQYEKLFDGITSELVYGEACPAYVWSRTAPDRILADIPNARLVATLRNPADRTYSGWVQGLARGHRKSGSPESIGPGLHEYRVSFYADNLRRYYDRFPRERIKVLLFDDIVARPDSVMRELFDFLGVDPEVKVTTEVPHNPSRVPRSGLLNRMLLASVRAAKPVVPLSIRRHISITQLQAPLMRKPDPIPPHVRQRLLDEFRDDILATQELIGRDLSHWLKPKPGG